MNNQSNLVLGKIGIRFWSRSVENGWQERNQGILPHKFGTEMMQVLKEVEATVKSQSLVVERMDLC